jgi:signal transduction histidine kinase
MLRSSRSWPPLVVVCLSCEPILRIARTARGQFAHSAEPLPIVWANGTLLRQVLFNLLSNALKYVASGETPKVQISAEVMKDGQTARIKVQDDGIGIEPSLQKRIFRPFERLHTTEQYPGTGIGLAIVQKAIERMGGRVGVESELGKGSCFWVELPRVVGNSDRDRGLQPVPQKDHEVADVLT